MARREVVLRAALSVAAVAIALAAGGPSVSPVAADDQVARTLFIVDAEPGVPLLPNDVAALEGDGVQITSGTYNGWYLTVQAWDLVRDDRWFVRLSTMLDGGFTPGTWSGMWQSGTVGATTFLDLYGGPYSQACSRSSSTFTVHELEIAGDSTVTKLALSFTWHCDGRVPAVYGEVRVNSTVPVAALRADRTSVGFEPVAIGSAAGDQVVLLENPGSVDMAPSVRLTGLDADAFVIVDDACTGSTVAPGAACQVVLRYAPLRSGPAHAFLEVLDGTPRGLRTIDLEGTTVPQ